MADSTTTPINVAQPDGSNTAFAPGYQPGGATQLPINSTTIAPTTPIPYTSPAPTPLYPISSLDSTVPAPVSTPALDNASTLTTQLEKLNDSLLGKSADQTAAEDAAGLPDQQKTLNDLSAQLTGLQNEAKAIPLQLEQNAKGAEVTTGGFDPLQTGALRNNAIQALTVSTLLEATKGNIANAQALADKTVAQKYDPIQEQITAATANLKLILNSSEASQEEKAQAQSQLDAQNAKQQQLEKDKTDTASIQTTAIDAAKNGADSVTLRNITQAKTPAAALIAAGKFASSTDATSVQSIGGRKVLIDNKTGNTIKDLGPDSVVPKALTEGQVATTNTVNNIVDGSSSLSELTSPTGALDSNYQNVKAQLTQLGFYNDTPPSWYVRAQNDQFGGNVLPSVIQAKWGAYKAKALGTS